MSGGLLAGALLLACLAFALAFVPRRTALLAAVVAAIAAVVAAAVIDAPSSAAAFTGCWISLGLTALAVYWPRLARSHRWLVPLAAANSGVWAGLVVRTEAGAQGALFILPALLLAVPAALCAERGWAIAVRIATSWLLAVAILVGAIPHLVEHPGYVPDHRE